MRIRNFNIYFIFGLLYLLNLPAFGQVIEDEAYLKKDIEIKKVDEKTWQEVVSGMDFEGNSSKKDMIESSDKEGQRKENAKEVSDSEYSGQLEVPIPTAILEIFKFIFIGLAVVIIVFLLFQIVKGSSGISLNTKIKNEEEVGIEELSHEMPRSELEIALDEALKQKDFRKIIRIYYLISIKELSERNLIKWKKDKTNYNYIDEIRGKSGLEPFEPLTILFEWAWYGDQKPEESKFQKAENLYQSLLENLKQYPSGE
ncbi:hypothetical protein [Flexithrix dorotheae]|uniref:hypothetical protein n=1 Tax=Flexithrix dorotheae TaxID=70993 RepID=UPI0012FB8263|nr:hypothetical protein [Flexithrix dorotheae]